MIDLFKKDLRIQLSSIEDSININNYNVEQLCLLSFLILEEKNGEISIDDLCKRIVDSVNGDIDAIKARIIAVFVINKFETYTKLRKSDRLTYLTNSVKSDKATNEQYVQTDTQLKSKKVVDGRHENSSRDNVNNNPSLHKTAKSSRDTSSPKEDNEQLSSKNKHDNNINEHKDKSGLITFLGVLFTSISLCYLLDLRWGYTFSILFFMFMLYSCINSIFKNKADKVNMYFFGVTGVALTLTSLIVMFSFSDFNYEKSCSIDTVESYQAFINKHPLSSYVSSARANIARLEKLATNRLEHGAQPYSAVYGYNSNYGSSAIKVVAPQTSDVVVLIKEDNSKGDVVAHAYLRSGCSYTFKLISGTYQTFFYYGSGWNPQKKIGNIYGGFINDEIYSKDDPQNLYYSELTYTLQLSTSGNFRTKRSNSGEAF